MNRMLIAGALLVAGSLPSALPAKTPLAGHHRTADARLKTLYDGYAAWDAKQSVQMDDGRGGLQPGDRLPRVDEASQRGREAHLKELLGQLDAIPVAQLSPGERVNAAVFRTVLENALIEPRFRTWEMPFNSDSSFWTYLDFATSFDSAAEYRRYIARMRDIPRYFDEQIVNMRAGLARGFSVPRATLDGPRRLDRHLRRSRSRRQSPFYRAVRARCRRPSRQREQQALRAEGGARDQAVGDAGLSRSCSPSSATNICRRRGPRSRRTTCPTATRSIAAQIREYTTIDMSPRRSTSSASRRSRGSTRRCARPWRTAASRAASRSSSSSCKTDPQFYAKTPDELMGVSAYVAKRVDGKIGNVIGTLPRRRFGIVPVAGLASRRFTPSGRGGVGPDWIAR